jgi:sugar-specific transcriptional regulator TrmB
MDGGRLSLERVLKTLTRLGLTQTAAEVYIQLAKRGPLTEHDLSSALKLTNQQISSCLESLQDKGIVISTFKHSFIFSAMPFEKALDKLIKANIEEAQLINEEKAFRKRL